MGPERGARRREPRVRADLLVAFVLRRKRQRGDRDERRCPGLRSRLPRLLRSRVRICRRRPLRSLLRRGPLLLLVHGPRWGRAWVGTPRPAAAVPPLGEDSGRCWGRRLSRCQLLLLLRRRRKLPLRVALLLLSRKSRSRRSSPDLFGSSALEWSLAGNHHRIRSSSVWYAPAQTHLPMSMEERRRPGGSTFSTTSVGATSRS